MCSYMCLLCLPSQSSLFIHKVCLIEFLLTESCVAASPFRRTTLCPHFRLVSKHVILYEDRLMLNKTDSPSCGPLLLLFAYTEHRVRRYCIVVLATRWLFLYTLYANRSVSRSNIQTYVRLAQLWKLVPIYRVRRHCIVVLVTRWLFLSTLCANRSVSRSNI